MWSRRDKFTSCNPFSLFDFLPLGQKRPLYQSKSGRSYIFIVSASPLSSHSLYLPSIVCHCFNMCRHFWVHFYLFISFAPSSRPTSVCSTSPSLFFFSSKLIEIVFGTGTWRHIKHREIESCNQDWSSTKHIIDLNFFFSILFSLSLSPFRSVSLQQKRLYFQFKISICVCVWALYSVHLRIENEIVDKIETQNNNHAN